MAKLKDLPKFDRPREKFLEKGPDALTKSELLAILLGSGIKGTNVKVLSEKILKKFGSDIVNATVDDLKQISGIGEAKALQISSALALTRRIYDEQNNSDNLVLSAQNAISLTVDLKDKKQEHLVCLYLNARNALLGKEIISIGTLDKSIIHPREIFALGLEMRAAGVILVHNHPSGDPTPSEQDRQVAKRIIDAGHLIGINVVDFLIVAKNGSHSILGELQNTKLTDIEYVAEGSQTSLFDLLVDSDSIYSYKPPSKQKKIGKFRFIDLFAGIGGFRFALEDLEGTCVFSSEINVECAKTYALNFGEYPAGDITKIDPKSIPDHDILCGGFPCQPFSISGKMKGFDDTRGTLFFNILEIIKAKNPKVVFLENVKHLKDHDNKKTLKILLKHLEVLGYQTEWHILNAKDFGLAQNRERLIIIGNKDTRFDFTKLTKTNSKTIKDILEKEADFEYLKTEDYTILPKDKWKQQESGLIFCGYRNKSIRTNGTRPNTEHLSRVHKQPNRIYFIDGTHPTIPSQETSGRFWIYDGKRVRKLTLNECFRLQGFPDNFKKMSNVGSCYNQIGNAVAVPMIKEVGKQILTQLF